MKPARRVAALVALAPLALLAAGCTGATPYAAIVNGARINRSELLNELSAIASNKAYISENQQQISQAASAGQSPPPSVFNSGETHTVSQAFAAVVLNTDIQAALIHAEVVRRHVEPSAADIAAAKTTAASDFGSDPAVFNGFTPWFQHLFEVQTAETLALQKAMGPVDSSPTAIQKFYDTNPADFITSECVSHILVASQSLAASIRGKIAAGQDFATLAKKYSTDTQSAAKGGDLGCNAPGGYVAPFEKVADSIRVGDVSQPVQSQFGWHIIKVTSRQTQALDAATKTKIQQFLQQEDPIAVFLQAHPADVQVNPEFGSWDPTQHVVPPASPGANSGAPTTTSPSVTPTP